MCISALRHTASKCFGMAAQLRVPHPLPMDAVVFVIQSSKPGWENQTELQTPLKWILLTLPSCWCTLRLYIMTIPSKISKREFSVIGCSGSSAGFPSKRPSFPWLPSTAINRREFLSKPLQAVWIHHWEKNRPRLFCMYILMSLFIIKFHHIVHHRMKMQLTAFYI